MGISPEDQLLIEQRVTREAKSPVKAYVIWILLGLFGGHRLYLGAVFSGVVMLMLGLLGLLTLPIDVGVYFLVAGGLWALVDLFLIPGLILKHQENVRRELTADALES